MPFDAIRNGRDITVTLTPGDDGTFAWLDAVHHDWEGALRAFRYLAQKAAAAYAPDDPKAAKIKDSIDRHIAALELLKTSVIDRVLPLDI